MKVVQINAVCGSGSTGRICVAVSELLSAQGIENYIFYASGQSDYPLGRRYMTGLEVKMQALRSRVLGEYGFNSRKATKKLLEALDEIRPDIVHLHNLHGHNCHLGLLFSYLKEKEIKVFWTFHDCFAFTGYCTHYDGVGCDRFQGGCHDCPQRKMYSWFFDRSRKLYEQKKHLFNGLDMTIVTPSHWLAEEVKKSFLKDCEIKVIHNGIDLSVFQPRTSDFRDRYALGDKFLILGVAFDWSRGKGLDVFVELSKRLDDRFRIVLVGTDEEVDKLLPSSILSIHRTQNARELAEIYTAADVFVNPTREENYPTVNMEAIACGTPVITFDTGGSAEIPDATCGAVVKKNDVDGMEREIRRLCEECLYTEEACLARAKGFDQNERFKEYVELYGLTEQI